MTRIRLLSQHSLPFKTKFFEAQGIISEVLCLLCENRKKNLRRELVLFFFLLGTKSITLLILSKTVYDITQVMQIQSLIFQFVHNSWSFGQILQCLKIAMIQGIS